jgi:hypothetical protein
MSLTRSSGLLVGQAPCNYGVNLEHNCHINDVYARKDVLRSANVGSIAGPFPEESK